MARVFLHLTHDDINKELPYGAICEGRCSVRWDTMHRKRRWREEFTEQERAASEEIFRKAKLWHLVKGAPKSISMTPATYQLWQKLGAFCASI